MARPVSNVVKTSLMHAKQKNGDIYVLERRFMIQKSTTHNLSGHN